MKDRILVLRENEKEVRKILEDLYAVKDLKHYIEDDFDYKEYFKEVIGEIIVIGLLVGIFYFLWFVLP